MVSLSLSLLQGFGDFNEILHLDQKNWGNESEANMIGEFRDDVQDYNLRDLGATLLHGLIRGLASIYWNRFLYSKDWTNCYQDQVARNLVTCSDHNAVLIKATCRGNWRHYKIGEFFQEFIMKTCGAPAMNFKTLLRNIVQTWRLVRKQCNLVYDGCTLQSGYLLKGII